MTSSSSSPRSTELRRARFSFHQDHHRKNSYEYGIGTTLDSSQLQGGDIPVTEEVTIESSSPAISNTSEKRLFSKVGSGDEDEDGLEEGCTKSPIPSIGVYDGNNRASFKSKRVKTKVEEGGEVGRANGFILDQMIEGVVNDLRHDQMEASHVLLSLNNETG